MNNDEDDAMKKKRGHSLRKRSVHSSMKPFFFQIPFFDVDDDYD